MKRSIIYILAAVLSASLCHARSNVLEREMEDYVRDLLRAHPKVAGEEKPRKARETLFKKAKGAKLLELSKAQEKKLRKREALVTDGVFTTAIKNMKSLNSKDPEVLFLLEYAQKEKIKAVEKTLAHRLLESKYKKAAAAAAQARGQRMQTIMAKYAEYKQANNKAPASLADLNLTEDDKQFTDPATGKKIDWIYIGHLGPIIGSGDTHVVLAEPIPNGTARICGMDNGKIGRFSNSGIEGHLNKIQERIKNGNLKPNPPTSPGQPSGNRGQAPAKEPSLDPLKSLMKKYMAYKKNNGGKHPSSLADLDLTDDEKQYTSPADKEKTDWIFLGGHSKIDVEKGIFVVVCSPKPNGGKRIIGLSDGRVGTIEDSDISKRLK